MCRMMIDSLGGSLSKECLLGGGNGSDERKGRECGRLRLESDGVLRGLLRLDLSEFISFDPSRCHTDVFATRCRV